jgi:hypothetical protein
VNGDGVGDVLVGALGAGPVPYNPGQSYVIFGRRTGFPAAFDARRLLPSNGGNGTEGFILEGIDHTDSVGRSVSRAGDVNGDGIDDLIVGSSNAHENTGESYVIFGRTAGFPALLPLASLLPAGGGDGSEGFVIRGIDNYDLAGYCVSDVGDVNGDGVDDVLIGAPYANPHRVINAGQSYVVFGRTSGFPPLFELRTLLPAGGGDGSTGFILNGIDDSDQSGTSLSGAGDVNGDGISDILIAAWAADPRGRSSAGESYVVFGRRTAFPAVFELAALRPEQGGDGSEGFTLIGSAVGDHSGFRVSDAGDVNADGVDDLIIGAPGVDAHGKTDVGASYVVFGRPAGIRPAR